MIPYNTKHSPILLKAYGREVQKMVEEAKQMADRDKRTAYAYRIVEVMKIVALMHRISEEEKVKLWNHLAQISNYELDIDYPCPIVRHSGDQHPPRLSYPQKSVRLRHYGRLFENVMAQIVAETDRTVRSTMIRQAAARMRRNLAEERGNKADVHRIARDIAFYSHDSIPQEEVEAALGNAHH